MNFTIGYTSGKNNIHPHVNAIVSTPDSYGYPSWKMDITCVQDLQEISERVGYPLIVDFVIYTIEIYNGDRE